MITSFSNTVAEKIGHYVYCLIDPRNQEVFYIGKGKGDRVFQHLRDALQTPQVTDKLEQLRKIKAAGEDPLHYILRHDLDAKQALEMEAALIDFARLCEGFEFKLKNLVKGHHSFDKGLKTAEDIVHYYDAPVVNIEEPSLIIIVNRLYRYYMTPDQLYNITHEKWRLNKHRINKVKYAFAAYNGIVREVYQVNEWYETFDERTQKIRYGFHGEIAPQEIREKYLHGSLENYKSNGSPTLYINC